MTDKGQITLEAVSLVGVTFRRLRPAHEADSVALDFRARVDAEYPTRTSVCVTVGLAVFDVAEGAPMQLEAEYELRAHSESPDGPPLLKRFAESNAVGVLIPYFRELFSSLTSRAGYAPFVLPPLSAVVFHQIAQEHPLTRG